MKRISREVDLSIDSLVERCINDLLLVMRTHPRRPVGVCAPQIGYSWRIFAFKDHLYSDGLIKVVVNPRIKMTDCKLTKMFQEGCLSAADEVGKDVERFSVVALSGLEWLKKEQMVDVVYQDLTAAIIQHEIDHLNGIPW